MEVDFTLRQEGPVDVVRGGRTPFELFDGVCIVIRDAYLVMQEGFHPFCNLYGPFP